jgi:hypothetical protein
MLRAPGLCCCCCRGSTLMGVTAPLLPAAACLMLPPAVIWVLDATQLDKCRYLEWEVTGVPAGPVTSPCCCWAKDSVAYPC